MNLTRDQKKFIKQHVYKRPLAEISAHLNLPESAILGYLKKKWPRDKYSKFLEGDKTRGQNSMFSKEDTVSFSFTNFFNGNRWILAFLFVLVLSVYANSFNNGFVSDDVAGILNNKQIGSFSNVSGNAMHFSLSALLQLIAYHVGGLHPFAFRIINIIFHLGCVILIYTLLALSLKKQVAMIAAALFAVHPVLIESVSWISGGLYAIYAFFFLLSLLFYLLAENNRKYFYYSIIFYVFAIFSSEKALVLFLVFILYELSFGSLRNNWKKIIPYFSVSFFLLILYISKIGYRESAIQASTYQTGGGGLYNPLVQIPVAIGNYIKLIFWPAALSLYQTEMNFSQFQYFLLSIITLMFFGAIIWSYFKNKTVFFWLAFFVITLLPTLTPFKISWIVAERYVYLGTLGIIVVIALFFDKLLKLNENSKMIGYFALVVIVSALSVRTILRNRDWRSEDTLWLATARVAPSGQQIHNNLGDVYARQGDYQKAIEEFTLATQINPNYADAYHNLANTYQQVGQLDLALQNYQKAASINPNLWQSYQNMAAIFYNQEKFDLALENIKKALEINPSDQNLQQNLTAIQLKIQGQ